MHVPTLEFTKVLAIHAHRGQFDKAGKPYIFHPMAVAEALTSHGENAVHAGWLHDVVEDTPITLEMLRALGYPEEVVCAVASVTRQPGETYMEMVQRAAAHPLGCVVKMADNRHNFGRLDHLPEPERAFLHKRYTRAYAILEAAHEARTIRG
jgi:(p)ppGpp synthase/HD superfamily hydrolase